MENAKKNLVFHFGVGRQASFLKISYVKYAPLFNKLEQFIIFLNEQSLYLQSRCIYNNFDSNFERIKVNWDKEQQSKAQNSDSKYRQMALTGFDT